MVKPLCMDEFADIVKERAFSWASIIRVKNTCGVKWSYEDKSRPLIGRIWHVTKPRDLCVKERDVYVNERRRNVWAVSNKQIGVWEISKRL